MRASDCARTSLIQDDLPGDLVEDRAEDRRSEDDECDGVEQLAALVDELADVAVRVASQRAQQEAAGERGHVLPPSAVATPAASSAAETLRSRSQCGSVVVGWGGAAGGET